MRLKNYKPAKNEVLCELREYKKVGSVITPNPVAEKIMRVLAVGPMCTATKVGDFVLMAAVPMIQLEFEEKGQDGKPLIALQGMEYNIMSYYTPDPDETKILPDVKEPAPTETQGPQNIIDNAGIEHSPYLKEQENFIKNL